MLGNSAAGMLGIGVQLAGFLIVAVISARGGGVSRGLVYGGVVAVYGYALVISFFSLLDIPWQVTNVVLALVLILSMLVRGNRRLFFEGLPPLLVAARRAWGSIAIVLGILVLHLTVAAVVPELSIDGQLYHGPALANIVQSGSLWGWPVANEYVYYTDLSMAGGVNLATFTGDTRFDHSLQIPHLLLLVFVINWALSIRFSSAYLRVSLATLIASAPVIWLQPRILYVDLAYGVAVAASIFFAVLVREYRKSDVLIAGILVGAVFATKPSGILTGMILLGVLAIAVIVRRHRTSSLRATVGVGIVGFGLPLFMAMSFYIRNLVQFGNPVYPVQAKFGPIVFPGILDLSVFASGERGNGLVDPARLISYFGSIGFGMVHGVTKLDYDPRVGGFGFVPLVVLALALALIAGQVFMRARDHSARGPWLTGWKAQVGIVALAAAILLAQPSTFDARYVIGPTVVLLVVVLLTSIRVVPTTAQLVAATVALAVAFGQVVWTERTMYPGLNVAMYLMRAPAGEQPNTPGNPWGRGLQVAWMPEDADECFSIALQTEGGLTSTGMGPSTFLATLPYGLYGDLLCNRVSPISMEDDGSESTQYAAEVRGADYLVLYENDVDDWEEAFPDMADCLTAVYSIDGDANYPLDATVLRNTCV